MLLVVLSGNKKNKEGARVGQGKEREGGLFIVFEGEHQS
jgi:hypothetical protein